ncbi:MAG TPA: 16S rRNA (adenine(1518)-N(6)/adenine(1519)-N(6))-dimethyltransferase RsmA [Candidatus Avilachnospira avicola]|nr:16S rRNA (adenine(1518)-N(6)/adenine(1519)-N(6))-dimethyltransferase RsmA [Candidatus Avilachnospira avicola]
MAKKLSDPKNTAEVIKKNEFAFKKKFGQNFLVDDRVLQRIVAGAGITKEDRVLEIGPGIGTLTQALCEAAGEVRAVEIDRDLIPILKETLSDYDNVEIINADVMDLELSSVFSGSFKVVANLPYYITTPIIMRLFESGADIESITVMVQKEVADRMQAAPGGKDYGALTLSVAYNAEAEIIANVPPNCFMPRPEVSSAVIRLKRHEKPPVAPKDPAYMFSVIRAAFSQRRKTLQNALSNDRSLGVTKDLISEALSELGLDQRIRGERLSLSQFSGLSDLLLEKRAG